MSEGLGSVSRIATSDPIRLISRREVERLTSLSRSTLYDLIRKQHFPAPVKVSERRSAWVQWEIEAWIEQKCSRSTSSAILST